MHDGLPDGAIFLERFAALTDRSPFLWQRRLYEDLAQGRFENLARCDIPTGLGKTSVVAIWLLALAAHPERVPRRLVYVVNRRTVVDQTTEEIRKLQRNLARAGVSDSLAALCVIPCDHPLAVSTLRGQFADNREWSSDPCRPAVIVGTVDLIGSRLLFNGYRAGFKTRPLQAAFLGQDALIVHDEAHLEPAFQKLLLAIEREQAQGRDGRPIRVIELSATTRGKTPTFQLLAAEASEQEVAKRLLASKRLELHSLDDPKQLPERLTELALRHQSTGAAVLIFARSVETVEKVAEALGKGNQVQKLTGTMRGEERDAIIENKIFRRFLPDSAGDGKDEGTPPVTGPVYLVCTSAGEVGVNISADHLVCDLTPFDSMTQRLGRVNRFGIRSDTVVAVACPTAFKDADDYDARLQKTLALLTQLNGDASSAALRRLDPHERADAFSAQPEFLETSEILFDAWALTSILDALPGRPKIEPYLHGIVENELPSTEIAWREEVGIITGGLLEAYPPAALLADYPLKPRELLRDRSDRVWKHLEKMAQRDGTSPVWIIDGERGVEVSTLAQLIARKERDKNCLTDRTLLLSPAIGGLDGGLLAGSVAKPVEDVADSPLSEDPRTRLRVWDGTAENSKMRLIREIKTREDVDDEPAAENEADEESSAPARQIWRWYELPARADNADSKYAPREIPLREHTDDVEAHARRFAEKLGLPPELAESIRVAGKFHDYGKDRAVWQRSIGNFDAKKVLAKSDGRKSTRDVRTDYRHEVGSLLDIMQEPEFRQLPEEMQDVTLHLIAAHHGRARPHFTPAETLDPQHAKAQSDALAAETPRRFARLQRRYGRWGLAFLESLLRAADYAASANPSATLKENS